MQELIKKIEQWGYDRNLQTANPLIQTTKTLEEVIELQQAIINYEEELKCNSCDSAFKELHPALGPMNSNGFSEQESFLRDGNDKYIYTCNINECKYLTDIKDAIGDIFVTLVMLSIQIKEYNILAPSDKVTQYKVEVFKSVQTMFNIVFEIQQQIKLNDFNHSSSFTLFRLILELDSLAKIYELTLNECVECAYKQIKNRKGKMINGLWVKEE